MPKQLKTPESPQQNESENSPADIRSRMSPEQLRTAAKRARAKKKRRMSKFSAASKKKKKSKKSTRSGAKTKADTKPSKYAGQFDYHPFDKTPVPKPFLFIDANNTPRHQLTIKHYLELTKRAHLKSTKTGRGSHLEHYPFMVLKQRYCKEEDWHTETREVIIDGREYLVFTSVSAVHCYL